MSLQASFDFDGPQRPERGPAPTGHRRLLLRPEEAAQVLGIGRSTLYELMAAGEVESVRIGKSRRIPIAALEDYVERLRANEENSCDPQGLNVS